MKKFLIFFLILLAFAIAIMKGGSGGDGDPADNVKYW